MILETEKRPSAESSCQIIFSFTNITPKTLYWSLQTREGTYVNNRRRVAVSSPSDTLTITLSGRDLVRFSDAEDGFRVVTVEGTYDKDSESDIPFREQMGFFIEKSLIE